MSYGFKEALSTIGGVDAGGRAYVTVYNNTGSAISNGAIKILAEMWISGKGIVLVPIAPATNATETNLIGVCENAGGSIADATEGQFLVKGVYGSTAVASNTYGAVTGTVAANDVVEVINGGVSFIDSGSDGGAVQPPEGVGIVVEVITATSAVIYLFGKRVQCKSA